MYYGRDRQRRLKRRKRLVLASLAGLVVIIGIYLLISSNLNIATMEPEDASVQDFSLISDTIETPQKEVAVDNQREDIPIYAGDTGKASPDNDEKRLSSNIEKNPIQSSSSKPAKKSKTPVYEVISVAHFYDKPSLQTRRKDSINYWNQTYASVKPITKKNGFMYVEFKYPQGQVAKGWLRQKDLKEVNTAYENNKD
jgi:hypothetical protein